MRLKSTPLLRLFRPLFLVTLFAMSAGMAHAQITIPPDSVRAQFEEGGFTTQSFRAEAGQETAIQGVLDQVGEGGTYDFSGISLSDTTGAATVSTTQSAPFGSGVPDDFPAFEDADYVQISSTQVTAGSNQLAARAYQFVGVVDPGADTLGGSYTHGSLIDVTSDLINDEVLVKSTFDPAFRSSALPLENTTSWSDSSTTEQRVLVNGEPDTTITSQVELSAEVIGYGTLIIPGGQETECLVVHREETQGDSTTFTYEFRTHAKFGARAEVDAEGQLIVEDGAPQLFVTIESESFAAVEIPENTEGELFDSLGVTVNFTDESSTTGTLKGYRVTFPPPNDEVDNSDYDGEDITKVSQDGFWVFEADSLDGFDYTACFDYSTLSGINDPSALVMLKRPDATGPWMPLISTVDTGAQQVCTPELETFSEFAIGSTSTNPLPVELASFEATVTGQGGVALSWRTLSEQGNDRFEIERQVAGNGTGWTRVATVESKADGGTTVEATPYTFTDKDLPFEAERLTYRLVQYDLDNTREVLGKKTIEVGTPQTFALESPFPNPAHQQVTLRYALPQKRHVTVALYDARGRQVRTLVDEQQHGRQETTFATGELASGVYFVRMTADDFTDTQRVVVVR